MEITQQQINAAYRAATTPEIKQFLDALFGTEANQNACQPTKDNRPVTERIKTFEDACRELGENNVLVQAYKTATFNTDGDHTDVCDVMAYLKLRIIVAALNEGWEPKFVKGEYRWAPWFSLLTNEEIDKMDDEDKDEVCRVVGRSNGYADAYGGLVYSDAGYASSNSSTYGGSRLAFKTSELAEYAGKQFIEFYRDMMIDIDE